MTISDRALLASINTLADVTLTENVTAETAYPLTNAQNQISGKPAIWDASGSPATLVIEWTGATAYTFNFLAMCGVNFHADHDIKVQLYPNAGHTGTPYDSGDIDAVRIGSNLKEQFVLCFDDFSAKSGRITITTNGSFVDSKIVIDKLYGGFAYTFEYGHEHGSRFWVEDNSEHTDKPAGGLETYDGHARRRADLIFNASSTTELITIQEGLEIAKKGGDLFLSADPQDTQGLRHKRSGIYRRNSNIDFSAQHYNRHDHGISLIES